MNAWPKFLVFLIAGYLAMTRSFAYIGIPPVKLFIGEMTIAAFLFWRPRAVVDRWLSALTRPSPLSGVATLMAIFLAYGVFEVIRGLAVGYSPVITLEGFAFHYYPVCFFIGLWAGRTNPGLLRRVVRVAAWVNGIYGLLFIVLLNRIPATVPGTSDVLLFGQPAGSAVAILGLLCLEPQPSRVWHLLLLNTFDLLALQVRSEFLGFCVALLLWGLLTRRFGRLLAGCGAVAALLLVGWVSDFSMPAPRTRGGQISTRDIIGRVVAPFDSDLASEYASSAADAKSEAGTAQWRIVWWHAIWDTVHQDVETGLIGEGYGYPLADLVGYKERDIRTPHSVFFYALAYGGWIGVAIFLVMQLALAQLLWAAFRMSGQPFGLVYWIFFFGGAFFGNAFETPFGAIPFYLLTGLAAAPAAIEVRYYARPAGAQLLSAARG